MAIPGYTYEDAVRDLKAQYGTGADLYALIGGVTYLLFTAPATWDFAGVIAYVLAVRAGQAITVIQVYPTPPPTPPPPAPSPPPTINLGGIVAAFQGASTWCYNVYLTVFGWIWPFNSLAEPFWQLSQFFFTAAGSFAAFQDWLNGALATLSLPKIWEGIKGLILSWLPGIEPVVSWFSTWYGTVWQLVNRWWYGVQGMVQGWIAAATQGLGELRAAWTTFWTVTWPQWTAQLEVLRGDFGAFLSATLPTLVTFSWLATWWSSRLTEVQGLINSAFAARESLWSGWQAWREKVAEFFADPVEYVWARFADWFLGPEV